MPSLGQTLILVGLFLIVIGGMMLLLGGVTKPSVIDWLGRLPGDILIERKNFKVYFPLTTSLVISAALSLLFWLLNKR